jgi:cytoskeleton protein RodZ
VALGFSIWGVISGRQNQSGKAASNPVVVTAPQSESGHTVPKQPPMATTVTPVATSPKLTPPDKGASSKFDASEDDGPEVSTRHLSDSVPVKPVTAPPTKADNFTVLVTAEENSWLSIKADGRIIFTGTLIAPGVQLVHASESVELRAGNLGGLEIDFNGKRLPPQGATGEAKTLTFRKDGLEPSKASGSTEATPLLPAESSQNRN